MKAIDKKKLATAMSDYLQLKELTTAQEKQMETLKGEILAIAQDSEADFTDGELTIEGAGLLKWVNSPAKVVFTATGNQLNDIETLGLVAELGDKYKTTKVGLNVNRLKIAVEQKDQAAATVLLNYGVKLLQSKRLDVKSA